MPAIAKTKVITVHNKDGSAGTAQAQVIGRLGVHRSVHQPGLWTVTHLSTGLTVCWNLADQASAMRVARVVDAEGGPSLDADHADEARKGLPKWLVSWLYDCKGLKRFVDPQPYRDGALTAVKPLEVTAPASAPVSKRVATPPPAPARRIVLGNRENKP